MLRFFFLAIQVRPTPVLRVMSFSTRKEILICSVRTVRTGHLYIFLAYSNMEGVSSPGQYICESGVWLAWLVSGAKPG